MPGVGSNGMAHPDTFGARSTLAVGDATHEIFRLDALQSRYDVARLPYTLRILLENVLRREDGATVTAADVEAVATWDAAADAVARDHVRARARPAPGLHRRPRRRRPRRDARRDARARRRPEPDRPAHPRRARDRPLGAGGRLREPARDHAERRARVQAQPRALRLPPLGPGRVRHPQGRAAEHGHLPPGEPRVPRPRRRDARWAGVPRHARRHGLAHDDDQRPRRPRLGRRRDRGRGGDARRGDLHARPAGRRLPAPRPAAGGRDRDRPRPHGDPDPAPDRRRREVRRVLRRGPRRPPARRPRDDREHVARVRRDLRLLPRRRGDAPLPAPHRPQRGARRARRGVLQGEPPLARPGRAGDVLAGRRARPRRGRAVARRAAAAAGPDRALRGQAVVPRDAPHLRRRLRRTRRRGASPSRSPRATRPRTPIRAPRSPRAARRSRRLRWPSRPSARLGSSASSTARSSGSTTAPS